MKTVNLQTQGSQFIHALFIDKNYPLANSFCEFPLTFTFENLTQEIYDTKEFEQFFVKLDKRTLEQVEIVSEKTLFQENSITTLFIELSFPLAQLSAILHLTLCSGKIRSFYFLSTEECECPDPAQQLEKKKAKKSFPFKKLYHSTLRSLHYLLKNTKNAMSSEQFTHEYSRRDNLTRANDFLLEQQKTVEKLEEKIPLKDTETTREINTKLKTILEHTNVFCWEYHPASDKGTMNFIDNNRQLYNNFTEILINFFKIAPDSKQDFIALHNALKQGTKDVSASIKVLDKNGEEWKNIHYTLIPSENEEIAIGTSENISEIKELKDRFSLAISQTGLYVFYYDVANHTLKFTNTPQKNAFAKTSFNHVPESFLEDKIIYPLDYDKFKNIFQRIEIKKELLVKEELRFKDFTTNQYIWYQVNFITILDSEKNPKAVLGTAYNIQHQKHIEETYNHELKLFDIGENDTLLLNCIHSFSDDKIIDIKSKIDDLKESGISLAQLRSKIISHCPDPDEKKLLTNILDPQTIFNFSHNPRLLHDIYFTFKQNDQDSSIVALKIILLRNPNTMDMYAKIKIEDRTVDYIRRAYIDKLSDHKYDFVIRVNYNTGTYQHFFGNKLQEIMDKLPFSGNYYHDGYTFAKAFIIEEERQTYLDTTKLQNVLPRLRKEGEFSFVYRTINRDKKIRYNRTHFFMLDEETQTFCCGSVDITNSYKIEQENDTMLHKSLQIAQEAIKSKSTFLASLSHDIRTPMNAIIGMVNLALDEPDNQKQAIESLNIIKSSSENLLSLINNFLEINRLESGTVAQHTEPFHLKEICTDIASTFKGIVVQKNQNLEYENINIQNDHVLGDESNLRRILTNLLGNAVKFTPNRGTIFFRLYQKEDIDSQQIGLYKIEIEDTGIGIAKEDLETIFEPYKRENTDTIKHIEGTGLGLAIVKTLVEMQGGSISVESEKGKGTKFILRLEYKLADKETVQHIDTPVNFADINLKGKHILLVEDHPINRLVATKLLEKMGAAIIPAKNGKIALEKYMQSKEGDIDFIFMDVQMPVMNGFEATKAIRHSKKPSCKNIPIIAMTANAFNEDVQKCLNAGMNAHIAKPISLENISNTLKKLVIIK